MWGVWFVFMLVIDGFVLLYLFCVWCVGMFVLFCVVLL